MVERAPPRYVRAPMTDDVDPLAPQRTGGESPGSVEIGVTRQQLMLTEKLAAIGEISARVAHELNQPLTAIRLMVDFLASRPDDRIGDHLRSIERVGDAARRMHRIVHGIRDFARRDDRMIGKIAPGRPVLDALELLEPSLTRRGIRVFVDIPDSLPALVADGDRLQQVFVNLFANAEHALEALPPGRSRTVRVEALLDRDWLVYHVDDDGPGIADEHLPFVFDPFFTTKRIGIGTGLGLSVSQEIVAEHGGRMHYESGPIGARFVVAIPMSRELADTSVGGD